MPFQPLQPPPRLQDASHRPGLGRRAVRDVRWSAVEDFADRAETGVQQMFADGLQPGLGRRRVAVDAIFGQRQLFDPVGRR